MDESDGPGEVLVAYIHQLLSDYALLSSDRRVGPANTVITDLIANRTDKTWTWDDAYAIDKALAVLLPDDQARWLLKAVRIEHAELAGEKAAAAFLEPIDVDVLAVPVERVRAELLRRYGEIQWLYSTVWVQDAMKDRLSKRVAFFTGVVLLGPTLYVGYQLSAPGPSARVGLPLLIIVMLCGTLGGLVSTLRRISTLSADGNPAINLIAMARSQMSTVLSPLMGAVFAAVLLALFMSGLLPGPLFPNMCVPEAARDPQTGAVAKTAHVTLDAFFAGSFPRDGVDMAKLLVWGFIAGFAERFVPDTLDRLSARGSEEKKA